MSDEVTEKYGVLMSPSVVINGVVKYNGKLPDHRVMERIIRETINNVNYPTFYYLAEIS